MIQEPKDFVHTEHFAKHIHTTLKRRMRLFLIMGSIMAILVVFDIVKKIISIHLALISILLGTLAGWATSRIFHLSWDNDMEKVVGKIDKIGALVLAAYIVFEISRSVVFSQFLHVEVTTGTAVTFAFVSSALISRVFSLRRRIIDILKKNK